MHNPISHLKYTNNIGPISHLKYTNIQSQHMKVINNKQFIFLQINIFGTLVGIFMPALLPKCCAMYEVGCYYIDGTTLTNYLWILLMV